MQFQYGKTYSYLAITLIPRFIWPDKPSVNDANRFYQVAYGITTSEDLDSVSIAVGFLVESFINFGWFGDAFVMFLIGMILGLFERVLLAGGAGMLFNGIGMSMVFLLTAAELQAAQYIGGLIQPMVLALVIFAPVVRFRSKAVQQTLDGEPVTV